MDFFLTAVVFILIFSLLVLVHEFGHFWMAKRAGIKVEEFGMGLPPRIWGKKKGETLYSINWIPFGGFVRMYGELGGDQKMLKSKRSFVGQSARNRIKVVVAGVLMNFILAWVLLTAGFIVGMQPLLAPADVLPAISDGQVVLEPGLVVSEVDAGSEADLAGFRQGDVIYAFNNKVLDSFVLADLNSDPLGLYSVQRDGENFSFKIKTSEQAGLHFYEHTDFPSVHVFDVEKYSPSFKAGLLKGDVILAVNGQRVFDTDQFDAALRYQSDLSYEAYRNGKIIDIDVVGEETNGVVISKVIPGEMADEAHLISGDVILYVEDVRIEEPADLVNFVQANPGKTLQYLVERAGQRLFFNVTSDENGRVGVLLSQLLGSGDLGVSVYSASTLSSVTEIKDQKYPFYIAPVKAFTESIRMGVMTGKMFVGIVGSLFSGDGVPSSVAGPVGIAKMTYSFVQEGSVVPLMRFVALLSLSLAVINILPIPALDGGRLLFILVEVILGRRLNQRWEAYVHAFGYLLILALILLVTYNDIFG